MWRSVYAYIYIVLYFELFQNVSFGLYGTIFFLYNALNILYGNRQEWGIGLSGVT